jgi:hypothetical protein
VLGWPKKMQVGPCIPVGMQLQKAEVGPTSGPTLRLSHSRGCAEPRATAAFAHPSRAAAEEQAGAEQECAEQSSAAATAQTGNADAGSTGLPGGHELPRPHRHEAAVQLPAQRKTLVDLRRGAARGSADRARLNQTCTGLAQQVEVGPVLPFRYPE